MARKKTNTNTGETAPARVEKIETTGENRFRVSADLLSIAPENMRKTHVFDPALAASIKAHGLINPLICRAVPDGDSPVERFLVVDGGRRWTAIEGAIRTGDLPGDFMVDIFVKQDAGKEISLAANQYLAPHPLDKCEAILELAKTEDDEVRLAAAFGLQVKVVKQYAALAALSDKAKQAYRDARFDMGVAALMTRLTHKQQDALCKGTDRIYDQQVKQTIAGTGVDCSVALFDWKTDYPKEKQQASLFDDIVMLLDRDLFIEMQDKAVNAREVALMAEGFVVVKLDKDDYLTEGKYVEYTGKLRPEDKKLLIVLVKPMRDGVTWWFSKPVMLAKDARKLEKVKGGTDKTSELPKKLTAKDLSPVQTEILNAHIIADIRLRVATGKASEAMVQWLVIAQAVGTHCHWVSGAGGATSHNGTDARWARLQKDHPAEFTGIDAPADRAELQNMTFDQFAKLKAPQRHALYLKAVAAMLHVPLNVQDPHTRTAKDAGVKRVVPGEAFFKRWRTDQILDYLKRSGVTKESGKMPIDSKKSTAVSVAVATAATPGAWQFNIPDKE